MLMRSRWDEVSLGGRCSIEGTLVVSGMFQVSLRWSVLALGFWLLAFGWDRLVARVSSTAKSQQPEANS
jgi:hypothetical protein